MFVFKHFMMYSIMVGAFPQIAETAEKTLSEFGILPTMIVIILMVITVLPEVLLVFPSYRKIILEGISDGDGVVNRDDLKYFISWYGPFIALRCIIFFSLFSMVQPTWEPSNTLLWVLVAVGTGTALPQIKSIIGK